jgi:hypothetical protein
MCENYLNTLSFYVSPDKNHGFKSGNHAGHNLWLITSLYYLSQHNNYQNLIHIACVKWVYWWYTMLHVSAHTVIIIIIRQYTSIIISQNIEWWWLYELKHVASYTTNKLILHMWREWDSDNCCVVTDNKGKYKQTQHDALLEDYDLSVCLQMPHLKQKWNNVQCVLQYHLA